VACVPISPQGRRSRWSARTLGSTHGASVLDLRVFDVAGRRVATLARGRYTMGDHAFEWKTAGIPSGVYFIRAVVNGEPLATARYVLVR
jgi:hypothetical protein